MLLFAACMHGTQVLNHCFPDRSVPGKTLRGSTKRFHAGLPLALTSFLSAFGSFQGEALPIPMALGENAPDAAAQAESSGISQLGKPGAEGAAVTEAGTATGQAVQCGYYRVPVRAAASAADPYDPALMTYEADDDVIPSPC